MKKNQSTLTVGGSDTNNLDNRIYSALITNKNRKQQQLKLL
jgi:hypothetical protein